MEIPMDTPRLIEELDRLFPEKCPSIDESEREIFRYAGKRELVVLLKTSLDLQLQQIAEDNREKGEVNVSKSKNA